MATTICGHCLCGNVAYEYTGTLGPAHYCHCEDCRRCTGSVNVAVRCDAAKFRIVSGTPKGYTKRADSGNELTRYFCPECGSPLYTESPKHPEYVYVKAGTLNDPRLVKPARQNWLASAVPWSKIDDGLPGYTKNPT